MNSEAINEIASALAKAQTQFKPIHTSKTVNVRTKDGRNYTYSYAELSVTLNAVRDALSQNGLSIVQFTQPGNETVAELATRLMHSSGQFIESRLPLDLRGSPQEIGSRLTYLRRYSINSLLCLATDDDSDDSAGVSAHSVEFTPKRTENFSSSPKKATDKLPVPASQKTFNQSGKF